MNLEVTSVPKRMDDGAMIANKGSSLPLNFGDWSVTSESKGAKMTLAHSRSRISQQNRERKAVLVF